MAPPRARGLSSALGRAPPRASPPPFFPRQADARAFSWVAGAAPRALRREGGALRCLYRVRHSPGPVADWCTVTAVGGALRATLDAPQRAVAAGQILALYDGEVCLGGGAITAARTSL